jgi:hypothetical protein
MDLAVPRSPPRRPRKTPDYGLFEVTPNAFDILVLSRFAGKSVNGHSFVGRHLLENVERLTKAKYVEVALTGEVPLAHTAR